MRPTLAIYLLFSLIGSASLFAQTSAPTGMDTPAWSAPQITHATSVRRGRTGERISWDVLLKELSAVDAVFLGETHVDETTHRVELAVFRSLLTRRSKKVVLSMEMFERDEQPILDRYLSGQISERQFLKSARPWSNYRTAYRPLIETAKKAGVPVVAANFPRFARRVVARGGMEALLAMGQEKKQFIPREIKANTKAYWRRVDNAVRGHLAMMRPREGDDDRLLSTQTLWDNAMGEAVALALDRNPGSSVVHVNGGFHTSYWSGTARQFKLRKPDARFLTIDIRTAANPQTAVLRGAPTADYVIFAESRARDLNEGKWAVHVDREVEYLLHMPKELKDGQRVPLLIWFTDEGLTAEDGMKLWKSRIGEEAAIAVVESPYPAVQFDMGDGGRWFWPDSFAEDMGSLNEVVERTWAYISRYYPVDPQRLVVAGEGAGATVAAGAAILSQRMDMDIVAFSPRRYAKIKDFPLPLPEYQGKEGAPRKTLHMYLPEHDLGWWESELEEYRAIGIQSEVVKPAGDPWMAASHRGDLIRRALGLKPSPVPRNAARRHIILKNASPRARFWARLKALRSPNALVAVLDAGHAVDLSGSREWKLKVTAEGYEKPFALPTCPGPFGGTTVVVLPQDITDGQKEAWIKVLDSKPLSKVSRFHRLRLAFPRGEHGLNKVLNELRSKGRRNVLIVPARFCAEASSMQMLAAQVGDLADQMTIHWLPGLGSE